MGRKDCWGFEVTRFKLSIEARGLKSVGEVREPVLEARDALESGLLIREAASAVAGSILRRAKRSFRASAPAPGLVLATFPLPLMAVAALAR